MAVEVMDEDMVLDMDMDVDLKDNISTAIMVVLMEGTISIHL